MTASHSRSSFDVAQDERWCAPATLVLWIFATLVLWIFATLVLWIFATLALWNFATLALWNFATLAPPPFILSEPAERASRRMRSSQERASVLSRGRSITGARIGSRTIYRVAGDGARACWRPLIG